MDDGATEEEFFQDFGASRLDDAAVNSLLVRARATHDVELRRLVKEVQMWRFLAPHLLDRVVPRGAHMDESDAVLKWARFVVRGDGAIAG